MSYSLVDPQDTTLTNWTATVTLIGDCGSLCGQVTGPPGTTLDGRVTTIQLYCGQVPQFQHHRRDSALSVELSTGAATGAVCLQSQHHWGR